MTAFFFFFLHLASHLFFLFSLFLLVAGARGKASMADVGSELMTILLVTLLVALVGFSLLLCAMILDDRRDAANRAVAGDRLRRPRPAE
jgi:hypothetical protein